MATIRSSSSLYLIFVDYFSHCILRQLFTAVIMPPKSAAKEKDPNAPKKPLSPYFLFQADTRPKIKAENPSMAFGDLAKAIGSEWKSAKPEMKKHYEKLAEKEKARYEKEMIAYKNGTYQASASNGSASTKKKPVANGKAPAKKGASAANGEEDNDSELDDESDGDDEEE
ncbi:unnamed protein product [Didymodactylos carnosus]|uniref:HMG box domain-containing protein n=1 Tax=Didymodactylos carnosus TaxID=1234261 RepID=A0A8S2EAR1_9BILA|nr:unnamed protein product [Didymodactylos carnosus]CAF3967522.1 unnamed protein product [Didymodactylos carnosus]